MWFTKVILIGPKNRREDRSSTEGDRVTNQPEVDFNRLPVMSKSDCLVSKKNLQLFLLPFSNSEKKTQKHTHHNRDKTNDSHWVELCVCVCVQQVCVDLLYQH